MTVGIEELALDYKQSIRIGEAYGFELHRVDDSDIVGSDNGKGKQTKKGKATAGV